VTTAAIDRAQRFPFPIPFGWFHIGFSADLAPGEQKILTRFGQELVLWRSQAGEFVLQDAYCPHLGAHFGHGGEVTEKGIKCPFHHWVFNTDGRVVEIPYAKKLNERGCVRTYPLVERHGIIMGWYHPHGEEPLYQLPRLEEFASDGYTRPITTSHIISTCLQEMGENTADSAHFVTVHGHPGDAEYGRFDFEPFKILMESTQLFPSSGGPVKGTLKTTNYGFGWAEVRYETLIDVCMLTTNCPIDHGTVEQLFHVSWKNPDKDPKVDRIGEAFNKEVNRQLQDDAKIWEHKRFEPNPILCVGDGPIAKYRKWAAQFYAESAR